MMLNNAKLLKNVANKSSSCFPVPKLLENLMPALSLIPVRTEYTRPGYGSRYGFTNWPMKKDYTKRQCVKENFVTRMRLNAIRKNNILPLELRQIADKEIAEEPRDSNPIRLVNRCVLTGRGRGTVQHYRVSRIMWRHFADYNKLSGVKRACW
ncbi:28S ribosomal protein S14, mitochondrial-like [Dreissena polymorpha]|uniref:28S ribosomal protein S14, mitochondrial-like n=1 Tax=Dreissena polymorpha TaxID=45954 RepID=UPI0022650950|nr:28S ribosomal protein S14, mitochondrial-like [Dreissena polymorpha]